MFAPWWARMEAAVTQAAPYGAVATLRHSEIVTTKDIIRC